MYNNNKKLITLLVSSFFGLFSAHLYAATFENSNISFFLATDHYIALHEIALGYTELYRFNNGQFSKPKVIESAVDQLNRIKRSTFTFWSKGKTSVVPDYLTRCNKSLKCVKQTTNNYDTEFLPYAVTVNNKGNQYVYLMPKDGIFGSDAALVSYNSKTHTRIVLHQFTNIAGGTNGNYVAADAKQNIIWVMGLDHNLRSTHVYECDFNGDCLLKKTFLKTQVYGLALSQDGKIGYFITGAPVILQKSKELPTLYKFDEGFTITKLKILNIGSPGQPIATNHTGSRVVYADYSPARKADILNNCDSSLKACSVINLAKVTQYGQHMQAISSVKTLD